MRSTRASHLRIVSWLDAATGGRMKQSFLRITSAAVAIVAIATVSLSSFESWTIESASAAAGCAPSPLGACNGIDGTKSSALLDISAATDGSAFIAGKGKLKLKIKGLVDASLESLGAPGGTSSADATMTDDLEACIYDQGVLALDIPIDAGASGWSCVKDKKCSFKGTEPSGLAGVSLLADTKADDNEKSAIQIALSSKDAPGGSSLIETQNTWSVGASSDVFDGVAGDLIVQVVNTSSGACWSVNVGGNGAGVDSSKSKNTGIASKKPHLSAKVKIVPGLCSNPSDPQCLQCPAGSRRDGAICVDCTAVPGCASVTCTSGSDSACGQCQAGYYLSDGSCPACTDVAHCMGAETCTSADNS